MKFRVYEILHYPNSGPYMIDTDICFILGEIKFRDGNEFDTVKAAEDAIAETVKRDDSFKNLELVILPFVNVPRWLT